MLKRVLEPEVMDSPQEALDYDAMDHSEVNRGFVADLLAAGYAEGEVLDLGTGTAQIPIELCQQHDRAHVVAVDLSVSMLDLARGNVEVESLTDRILLDRVDGKSLPYEDGRFACVMSTSIVHHIPLPAAVLGEAVRVTAPGGLIFFRDLLRPPSKAQLDELVQSYAGEANAHQQQMFAESLHAALTVEEMQSLVTPLGCPAESVAATSDRHWTWCFRKPA